MTKKKSALVWSAALLVLISALVFYNLPAAPSPAGADSAKDLDSSSQFSSDAPLGHQPGEQLADFSMIQTNGQTFTLSQYRGKVVVLNLWTTWCTPCVKELPHFDRLQQAYPDEVKVLAIHSDLITDDPLAYLKDFDYHIAFAVDESSQIISSLGGSTMLPQTLVLSPRGEVTYNRVGSVSYEALEELVHAAQTQE